MGKYSSRDCARYCTIRKAQLLVWMCIVVGLEQGVASFLQKETHGVIARAVKKGLKRQVRCWEAA